MESEKGTKLSLTANSFIHLPEFIRNVILNFIDVYDARGMIINQRPTVTADGKTLITSGNLWWNF